MNNKNDSFRSEFDDSDENKNQPNKHEINNNNYNDEKLTVELYDEISSTIYNCLSNSTVKNAIASNQAILRDLELQISNLLFLESSLKSELNERKNAIAFLQIISDVTNLEITVKKSAPKNRIEILGERNLLIVTVINTFSGVERESLETKRYIDQTSFTELINQISALNAFNHTTEKKVNNDFQYPNTETSVNGNNSQNPNQNVNNQFNNQQDLSNLNNLSKLGLLPQHPATSPNFYPYLSKPPIIPKMKKVLAGFLVGSLLLIIMTAITSIFVAGKIVLVKNQPAHEISMSGISNWLLIGVTALLIVFFTYNLLKPIKLKRELYHTSYFVLALLLLWLLFITAYFFIQTTQQFLQNILQTKVYQFFDDKATLDDNAVKAFQNLPNFSLFRVFSIITATFLICPALIVIFLILINPRLDRNKIIRANTEYQNAITAALSGQKYEIDTNLFDHDEPEKGKKKLTFSSKY